MLAFAKTALCAAGSTACFALRLAVGTEHLHKDATLRQLRCKLHRLGDATGCGLFELHAVDHHIDEMLDLLVERTRLTVQLHDLAIDANAAKALMGQVREELSELAFATRHNRRHDNSLRTRIQGKDIIGHLICGLLLDDATAFRAVRNAHARIQQSKIIINLGSGSHG